ncbi:MAG TPA: hypothetical protein VHU19_08110, partial [Pyrinomonadaceae bacterium]|nr:hypothetical protein [Pyrinomonadaceae bacterium]
GTPATKKTTVSGFLSVLTPSFLPSSAKNGTGTKFQLFTGSFATNDCVKFDASGNLVTAGAGCNSGTVTSVGLSVPGVIFSVSGSPVTGSGTLTFSLLTQSANTIFAGPTSGAAATPTWRSLVNADIPSTLSSKTLDNTNTANFKGTLFTLQDATDTTKQARFDLSNISTATTRTVNIPNANSTTAQAASAVSHQFLTSMSAQGVFSAAQPAAADVSGLAASATTDTTNAANITSGALPAGRMPALTGDCTTSAGAVATTCTKINGVDQTAGLTAYTPTVTCGSGTITTLGTVSGGYQQLGKLTFLSVSVAITTNGTCATDVRVSLPFTAYSTREQGLFGVETQSQGVGVRGYIAASGTVVRVTNMNPTSYPGGSGTTLVVNGWYVAQ